jgi:hypothetical protein
MEGRKTMSIITWLQALKRRITHGEVDRQRKAIQDNFDEFNRGFNEGIRANDNRKE